MKILRCLILLPAVFFMLQGAMASAADAGSAPEIDARQMVDRAYRQFLELENYHMTMDIASEMEVRGNKVRSYTRSECDLQAKPLLGRNMMNITMHIAAQKIEQQIEQYFVEEGGQVVVYSNMDHKWVKQTVPYYSPVDNYLHAIKAVTWAGENETSLIYTVTADAGYAAGNLERYMDTAAMRKLQLSAQALKEAGDFNYTITIDRQTGAMSGIHMDLTALMAKISNGLISSPGTSAEEKKILKEIFDTMTLVVDIGFSQLNSAGGIAIPAEARQAEELVVK